MNIRKITHNRRRQKIGNLVTGVLNHFGKSTAENLTETVLNYSSQPREYVEFAVRRTLNCGVRHGFLVKTGRNTFDVPHHLCETDYDQNNLGNGSPEERYDECLRKQHKQHTSGRVCKDRDLFTNENCKLPATRKDGRCTYHVQLLNMFNYRTILVKTLLLGDVRECLKQYYEEYIKLNTALDYINAEAYQKKLLGFLIKLKKYYFKFNDDVLIKTIVSRPVEPPENTNTCTGIVIEGDKIGQRCDAAVEVTSYRLCHEHHFYEEVFRGFSRSPKNFGDRRREKKKERTYQKYISLVDGTIAKEVLKIAETQKKIAGPVSPDVFDLLSNSNTCSYASFAIITRYHRLRLIGIPYKDFYYDHIYKDIVRANRKGTEDGFGNCCCLNMPEVFKKFGEVKKWPDIEYPKSEKDQDQQLDQNQIHLGQYPTLNQNQSFHQYTSPLNQNQFLWLPTEPPENQPPIYQGSSHLHRNPVQLDQYEHHQHAAQLNQYPTFNQNQPFHQYTSPLNQNQPPIYQGSSHLHRNPVQLDQYEHHQHAAQPRQYPPQLQWGQYHTFNQNQPFHQYTSPLNQNQHLIYQGSPHLYQNPVQLGQYEHHQHAAQSRQYPPQFQ